MCVGFIISSFFLNNRTPFDTLQFHQGVKEFSSNQYATHSVRYFSIKANTYGPDARKISDGRDDRVPGAILVPAFFAKEAMTSAWLPLSVSGTNSLRRKVTVLEGGDLTVYPLQWSYASWTLTRKKGRCRQG
jgi:hypothetical protein